MKNWICNLFLVAFVLLWAAPSDAASRFLVACTTTCTWDASNTVIWSATSGGAGGQSVPGSSDAVTLDANTCVGGLTCTITVNTTVTVQSITMGACTASTTGCILDFSANNNNVTLSTSFSGTGTGTRTLNMGNGTWTLTGTAAANIWQLSTTTGLTFSANSSTIRITGVTTNARTFQGGGSLTYNNLSVEGGPVILSIAATAFNDLKADASTGAVALFLPAGQTTTVASLTINGTSTNQVFLASSSTTLASTISDSAGADAMTWAGIRGIAFAGGATFTASNSFDLGMNSGATITAPSTSGGGKIIGG